MPMKIMELEQDALEGLPYFHRVLYYEGIRPYMDYATGIVGQKRRISYQSLAEELYIEPHKGYQSGSPCKSKIRRGLKGLENAGLISKVEGECGLVFKCALATWDFSAQNKVGTQSAQQVGKESFSKKSDFSSTFNALHEKAGTPKNSLAGTPPESGNTILKTHIQANFIFSEKFREKMIKKNFLDVDDEDTRTEFILFHQSRGTLSCDWEAEFHRWLCIRKKYHSQEKNHESGKNSHTRSGFVTAVDIVMQANAERFKKPYRRVIDG